MAPASSTVISKLKVQLKLSISRLRMVQQKDEALAKQQRRAMAQLLEQGKEESARIRVENIIRSDINTELLEILELYCELLLARTGLMESKECDPGLEEAVKSIIYAAPRTEVKELQQVRQLLIEKYGKEFAMEAIDNSDGKVAERVLNKLKVTPPQPELVTLYLQEIARTYGIDWPRHDSPRRGRDNRGDDDDEEDDEDGGSGGQRIRAPEPEPPLLSSPTPKSNKDMQDRKDEELSRATPPREISPRSPVVSVAAPSPRSDNVNPKIKLPLPPDLRAVVKSAGENARKDDTHDRKADDEIVSGPGKTSVGEGDVGSGAGSGPAKALGAGIGSGSGTPKGTGSAKDKDKGKDKDKAKTLVEGKIPDVDELAARFAALKKKR